MARRRRRWKNFGKEAKRAPSAEEVSLARRARAQRRFKEDEEWAALHKVRERFEQGSYRAVCSCNWMSQRGLSLSEAHEAGKAHTSRYRSVG